MEEAIKQELSDTEQLEVILDFQWTDDRVAEVSRIITEEYKDSEVWTSDLTAEDNIIERYKKTALLNEIEIYLQPILTDNNTKVIIDTKKYLAVTKYLIDRLSL